VVPCVHNVNGKVMSLRNLLCYITHIRKLHMSIAKSEVFTAVLPKTPVLCDVTLTVPLVHSVLKAQWPFKILGTGSQCHSDVSQ